VQANFVDRAEASQSGSAHARQQSADQRLCLATSSDPPLPRQWKSWVNKPQTDAEVLALRAGIQRGLPSATTAGSTAAHPASASKAPAVPETAQECSSDRFSFAPIVSSKEVPTPVAVRYAWTMNLSQRNLLYNKEGLPASPGWNDISYQ
jgi:hypothetical protein